MAGMLQDPNTNCHFRISVDLREVSGISGDYNIICRFSYPLFDQNHPSETSPPVKTLQGEPVDLPNGFFSCEFVTTENHLAQALVNRPLIVEVLHREYKGKTENADESLFTNDDVIGSARVNMMSLFDTPWFQDSNSNDSTLNSLIRVIDNTSPIIGVDANTTIGSLRLLLTLESFGEYLSDTTLGSDATQTDAGRAQDNERDVHEDAGRDAESVVVEKVAGTTKPESNIADSMNLTTQDLGNVSTLPNAHIPNPEKGNQDASTSARSVHFQEDVAVMPKRSTKSESTSSGMSSQENYVFPSPGSSESVPHRYISPSQSGTVVNPTIDSEALDYQTAWELTMWKRAEQAKWLAKLQEKETQRLREVEIEWKKQEIIREQQYQKRQRDVAKLEKKLKDSLFEVEQQEKRLRLGEDELRLRLANVEKEIDTAKKDALLSVQRIKDQHKHQLGMARMVHDELKRQYDIVKAKLAASQTRYNDLEEEYRAYKNKWQKSSSGQLRMVIQEKEQTVESLTTQVSTLTQKLTATKAHLVRCLQEIARMKKEQELSERQRLELERQDVERLRAELLAKQQSAGARRDGEELKRIKLELEALLHEGKSRDTGVSALATMDMTRNVGVARNMGVPAVGVGIGTSVGTGIIDHQNSENIFGDSNVRGGGILPTSSGISNFREIPTIYGSGKSVNEENPALHSLLSALQLQSTQGVTDINAQVKVPENNAPNMNIPNQTQAQRVGLSNSSTNMDNILQTPVMQTTLTRKQNVEQPKESPLQAEMMRLLREKRDMLSCGAFDDSHPVIRDMDKKIEQIRTQLGLVK